MGVAMAKTKPAEIVGKLVDLLTPLASEDRKRVIAAAKTLLGDALEDGSQTRADKSGSKEHEDDIISTSGKAKTWQKQNDIATAQLGQVFHVADGQAEVIAGEIPGKNKKEKTLNAYVLAGLAKLIATGSPNFSDKEARALCNTAGCYDGPNHAATLRAKGNWFTGSKDKGWILTTPGLKHAAALIKDLSADKND